jgi:hypothetical protein
MASAFDLEFLNRSTVPEHMTYGKGTSTVREKTLSSVPMQFPGPSSASHEELDAKK